ncbi:HlyD family secretion protein [Shimia biformata]|uniref:HlyD family secretion protein n=1 Tax=Shimia biformata TaxID=1294299 RepID=UPI00194FC37A|nr:HlyD family efflux transporter periplasmic adaptor subunit [Shimia biformata]
MKTFLAALTLSAAIPLLDSCKGGDDGLALGIVERERVTHIATMSEIITELPVEEGSEVERGDVLVRLDDTIQRSNLSLAEAELSSARANLDKLQAGPREEEIAIAEARVKGAKAALADAVATVKRNTVLAARDAVSQARLDTDLARQDAAQAELDSAREYLRELKNGARPEDIRIAETAVAAAQAKVQVERRRLDDLVVTASRDGVLDALPWNLGERVSAGSPVAILLAGERPFARVYVPEPYRVKVHEGITLQVRVDGIDEPLQGTVRWISAEPAFTPYYALNQTDRARLMYLAEIDLPDAAATLPSGVPAQAVMP